MSNPVIYFDGVCHLCNSSVKKVLRYDKKAFFYFAPLQGEYSEQHLNSGLRDSVDSIILQINNKTYIKSTAVLHICKYLSFPLNILSVFLIIPKFIRDSIYDWVAKNRYKWFGKYETCQLPEPQHKGRFLG